MNINWYWIFNRWHGFKPGAVVSECGEWHLIDVPPQKKQVSDDPVCSKCLAALTISSALEQQSTNKAGG